MTDIKSIGFALDPTNVPSFLLDWELTKLCNLDCSYCSTGIDGGHDNTTQHPPVEECLKSIDFMYEYVNQYMKYKKPSQRKVVLNVYGGESLFHPDIVEILQAARTKYEKYKDNWHLTFTCTTNGIVGKKQWARIVPLIDEFSVSYHAENLPKQKQQYLDNILYLREKNKRFKCVVMMHNQPESFADAEEVTEFCKINNIRYVAKPLDNPDKKWAYSAEQFSKLKTFWINKTAPLKQVEYKKSIETVGNTETVLSINEGRPCCGGRKLSLNNDLKSSVSFVPRQGFRDWSCSVNWFFLFVRQVDGAVYTNKDCLMSTTGREEPLGNISESNLIISTLRNQLETNSMPVIKCKKDICMCGFCAPKAESEQDFKDLIKRNVSVDVFLKEC
jgi:MoaA/NifB/PqqE/SkfB family radical SAM enzyme